MHARRAQDFYDVCVGYEERLEAAKQAVQNNPSPEAVAALKAAKQEMRDFRAWARTVGNPPEGVPGKDATIKIGGAVDG